MTYPTRRNVRIVGLEGLEGARKMLEQLPPEIVSKRGGPVRSALRKAMKVIHAQALANIQHIIDDPNVDGETSKSTGLLKKSLLVALSKPLGNANGEAYVIRVKRSRFYEQKRAGLKGKKISAWKVGFLLENGTERRKAYPWMRPAFEAKKEQALAVYVADLNKRLAQIVRKLERQNGVKR